MCDHNKPGDGEESQRFNLSKEALTQLLYLVEHKFQARYGLECSIRYLYGEAKITLRFLS